MRTIKERKTDAFQTNIKTLEWDKIAKLLAEQTACPDAAQRARELRPQTTREGVERLLQETDDAYLLMARFGSPSFHGLVGIVHTVRRAESGGVLNLAEFLRIAGVLRTMRNVTQWRQKSEGMKTTLDERFALLCPNSYLENRIQTTVLSEEEVADQASPELAAIRRKIRSASARVREQLDQMIRSAAYQKYLQDPIVTLRGGRFVVPVKAECRGDVPGLVHDTSSSGATVFIEPMSVVEANNDIRVLQAQEKDEIERILTALSGEVGTFAEELATGYEAAVDLNVIFAKASLAYNMKATRPMVNDEGRISLKGARHPLIDSHQVVPTDISLGKEFDTLVITGPNTGGKTVTLKTIGLLTVMAMCGLMLPVAEHSEVSVFSHILVDIGDEQSIEQSLSTFSAHMTHIIRILDEADERSLVLLDELGAGTDPVEGAALAVAVLEELRGKGAKIAATTHYAELKEYALKTAGVENACCEFDVATLRPTYRLLIGVPGRSNAFAISLRLGLRETLVERARELVSRENARFEEVVQNLESTRQALETEREQVEQLKREAVELRRKAEEEQQKIRAHAATEMEVARRQATHLVSRTRAQIDAMMEEMEAIRKGGKLTAEHKAKLRGGLRRLENAADPVHEKESEGYVLPRPLKVGDSVLIFDLDRKATVLELSTNSDEVTVQAGIIKTRVPLSNLRLLDEPPVKTPQRRVTKTLSGKRGGMGELDVRGETVIDALLDVDRFIDGASLSGIQMLTIIHGKGTGALRAAIHDHLKRHPAVRSYRLGVYGEGESGVTIVELKK